MLSQGETTRPSGSQAIERAAQLLVLVLDQEQPTTLGELARLTDLPKSTASRLVAALERNALVQRDSARGAIRPGPAVLRFAQRGVDDTDLVELANPVLLDARRRERRDDQPGSAGQYRREPPGTGRLAPHDRCGQLGRPRGAVPRRGQRQGLPGERSRRAAARRARALHASHDRRPRASRSRRSTRSAQSATRLRSTRSKSASRPSRLPCAARTARAWPRSPSPARASVSGRRSSITWVRCSSSRPPSCPPDSGTRPWSEDDDDARRDPAGTLRQHADRQQARGRRPRQQGPRGRHGAELDALRRAHPVARGGRRALRARRLLRARDADRRARHAGRARHPPPAARRPRACSRSARS